MGRTVQKTNLLGDDDGGDMAMGGSTAQSRARARRNGTPQHEYPIFTPGTGEEPDLYQQAIKKDPRRRSFTGDAQSPEDNMQGVWKEIYTDTQSTAEQQQQQQQLFMPFSPGQFLHTSKANPSTSPTQHTLRPPGVHHTPGGANGSIVPDVDLNAQSSTDVLIPPGKFSASPRSKYLIPMSSPDNSFVGNYMKRSNAPASPSYAAMSPRTNPSGERQPKLTQVNIMSPSQSEMGILTPTRSQAALSPDMSKGCGYPFDRPLSPARMLPPAMTRSPPHMEMLSPSASVKSSKSVMKASRRKVEQSNINNNNASPRGSVSRERSPWKVFKESLHAMSPALSTKDESHIRGFAKDQLNASFQGSGRRAMAAASANTASVGWAGCKGGMSTAAMDLERNTSESSSDLSVEPPKVLRVKAPEAPKDLKTGSNHSMFNFLSWGKKKSTPGRAESYQSDLASTKADSNSIKVMDYTIKTLQGKLEQSNKKLEAATNETRVMQSAMEASEEKCRQLQQRCQELEIQLRSLRSDFEDVESESFTRRRESGGSGLTPNKLGRKFTLMEVTPQLFQKAVEESKVCIKRLASTICHHIRDSGESATQVITTLLEEHKVGRWVSRMPRNVIILYFESFLNQVLYESFENVSFEPNGASSAFDPETLKMESCKAYQELKKQDWASVERTLDKPGSVVVNANFHRYFVVRMELILSALGKLAEVDASDTLMAAFFSAVKSVWLVHHLTFAFDPPVTLFRVAAAADFDPRYMDQVTTFEEEPIRSKISIMVNPGFIVNRQTIKCQVFCSSKYQ